MSETPRVETGAGPDDVSELRKEQLVTALEQLRPYLLTIALGEFPERLRSKLGASDLVQETILRGVENISQFRGSSREELASWLRQVLLREIANSVDRFGAAKRDVTREVALDGRVAAADGLTPSDSTQAGEDWELLRGALRRLPDDYRQAVILRHRENLSFGEMGRVLGRSEEAARKLWHRAIRRLQEELRHHDSQRTPGSTDPP